MFTVKEFVAKFENYSDDELFEIHSNWNNYSSFKSNNTYMFILYGQIPVCINRDVDKEQSCSNCNSDGVNVAVYRSYYHVFFLPLFPYGPKSVEITCPNCREPKWFKGQADLYEQATRTPLYFYTGPLIIAGIMLLFVIHLIFGI